MNIHYCRLASVSARREKKRADAGSILFMAQGKSYALSLQNPSRTIYLARTFFETAKTRGKISIISKTCSTTDDDAAYMQPVNHRVSRSLKVSSPF